ncbi:MAG: hypothetical protein QOK33_229, partial [Mycobacterium sp.]|nr:hypothetical protein [Mycobacterium sp.]
MRRCRVAPKHATLERSGTQDPMPNPDADQPLSALPDTGYVYRT